MGLWAVLLDGPVGYIVLWASGLYCLMGLWAVVFDGSVGSIV